MQIMVDTNVVLDVLLNRTAHVNESAAVLKAASDEVQEFISASAITDIYYIAQKELKNPSLTKLLIRNLLQIVLLLLYQRSTFGQLSIADGMISRMLFRIPLQNISDSTASSLATLLITAIPHYQ